MTQTVLHRIRLKGPWEVVPPGRASVIYERHALPQAWRALFGDIAGTAHFRRAFHRPTGLDSGDRVLIHLPAGCGKVTGVEINGETPACVSFDPLKFDITEELIPFNSLQFSLTFDPLSAPEEPGGLWETVYLEICRIAATE